MQKTTVADLGKQVPVGKELPDGTRARGFSFKPWRAKDERIIGEIRNKNRKITAGAFTSEVLCHFLETWHDQSLEGMNTSQKRLLLNQSFAADIYHAWIQLRMDALGSDFTMEIPCGMCNDRFDYEIDLGTIEADRVEDGEIIETPYRLRDGVEWKGELRHALTMGPLVWGMFESVTGTSLNVGDLKMAVLKGSVTGIGGVEGRFVLIDKVADELTKYDLEGLVAFTEEIQPGPDLNIECQCPACNSPVSASVSWLYDAFFSVRGSSRSEPQSTSEKKSSPSVTTEEEDSPSMYPIQPQLSENTFSN